MQTEDKLQSALIGCRKYLLSLCSSGEEVTTLHAMYRALHKITGLYWIVCAWKLIDRLVGDKGCPKVQSLFVAKFDSILTDPSSEKLFDMTLNGGALRCLSRAQLLVLLKDESERSSELEKLGEEALNVLMNFFPVAAPASPEWWFDMRSMYCLITLVRLGQVEIPDLVVTNLTSWIYSSQAILGGFGAGPNSEAHGGYTFCAISSLRQLGVGEIRHRDRLRAWCVARSSKSRFQGRPGKPSDSCYIWWIGATMRLIGGEIERSSSEKFLLSHCTVSSSGGFSKYPSVPVPGDDSSVHDPQDADLFHTFLAVASLALQRDLVDPLTVLPSRH
jgi:hypothetical protein